MGALPSPVVPAQPVGLPALTEAKATLRIELSVVTAS